MMTLQRAFGTATAGWRESFETERHDLFTYCHSGDRGVGREYIPHSSAAQPQEERSDLVRRGPIIALAPVVLMEHRRVSKSALQTTRCWRSDGQRVPGQRKERCYLC